MNALTICQPYAEMIAIGMKVIENRTWPTTYRGPLAIHAGKSREWLDDDYDYSKHFPDMTFGSVIAIVTLEDCVRLNQLPAHLVDNEHANGPWCWILNDVHRITPVPFRGSQGLWTFPDSFVPAPMRLT